MILIWHIVWSKKFLHNFENKDTPFHMEIVSMVLFELKDSVGIDVDWIQAEHGLLEYYYKIITWHYD